MALFQGEELLPAEEAARVLVWSPDADRARALANAASGAGRAVTIAPDEVELAARCGTDGQDLLVLEADALLLSLMPSMRSPFVVVRRGDADLNGRVAERAYAVVNRAAEVPLAIDRFLEHRSLSARAASVGRAPWRCSRCGRGYNALAGRRTAGRRFVTFGSVALCGSCVEDLRSLVQQAAGPYVQAEAHRS